MATKTKKIDKEGRSYASGRYAARVKGGYCARCGRVREVAEYSYCNACTARNRVASDRYKAKMARQVEQGKVEVARGKQLIAGIPVAQDPIAALQDHNSPIQPDSQRNGLPNSAHLPPVESVPLNSPPSQVAIPTPFAAGFTAPLVPANPQFRPYGRPEPTTPVPSARVWPPQPRSSFGSQPPRGVNLDSPPVSRVTPSTSPVQQSAVQQSATVTATSNPLQRMARKITRPKSPTQLEQDAQTLREHLSNLRALRSDFSRVMECAKVMLVAVDKMIVRVAGVVE